MTAVPIIDGVLGIFFKDRCKVVRDQRENKDDGISEICGNTEW